jgi:hypothetical protein
MYQKGCKACQRFRNIQLAPASVMNSIVKPCPFRGWGQDFIDEIHPESSKGHRFILVATDYFTKWRTFMEDLAEDIEGHSLSKTLNGKYLKCYDPSMWQDQEEDYLVKED